MAEQSQPQTPAETKAGNLFRSYNELQEKLEIYKKLHYVEFWKKEARTIQAVRRRMPDKQKFEVE